MKDLFPRVTNRVFKEMFLASPLAGYICDKAGVLLAYNDAAVALWGRKPEIGLEKWSGASASYYADGRPMSLDAFPVAMQPEAGVTSYNEVIIERPNGVRRNVLVYSQALLDEKGEAIGSHNTLVDITAYKQQDSKQALLSAIVESSDDAIVSKDLNGNIMSWNAGAQRIFGYHETEIIGKSINTLIPSRLYWEEEHIIQQVKAGKNVDHYQTVRLTKSGHEIPISLTISPMRNGAGQIIGASKIAREISEQIRNEQLMKLNARKLETLYSIGKVISEKLDVKFIIQTVIEATIRASIADIGICCYWMTENDGRVTHSVAIGGTACNGNVLENPYRLQELLQGVFADRKIVRFDPLSTNKDICSVFNELTKNGLPTINHCLSAPIYSADGELTGVILLGYIEREIYEGADDELIYNIASQVAVALENAKLFEEVNALSLKKNEFIALASHELKTPLTTIKGYLQILERYEINQIGQRFLGKALKQVDRIEALIAELLDISRIEAGRLDLYYETFDISELILDAVETFRFSSTTHQIIINDNQHIMVHADKQRIEQVLINLLSNAIKYSPESDKVYVTVETSDTAVTVKVTDEGMGMSLAQRGKIFTRFFRIEGTSKMPGLGLGLYLSKEIINRHNGHIDVESELGKGATFYFSIPYTQQDSDAIKTLFD
ncbi:PAS domain S-box protein [Parapedobacter lycopersici]|uniref:sensor histidine kinase n=1 Tax=Parapedobacter lycopersici TaxID=1864939 RepID=UPI0033420E30